MIGRTDDDRPGDRADPGPGIPAPGFRLPPETRPGHVSLRVSDLERSLGFYRDVIGFRELGRDGDTVELGAGPVDGPGEPLLVLTARPGARPVRPRTRLGLFHFAVLLPSRADFGRLLRHLADGDVPLGASDHGVSEALYLSDPDGLGMEIYRDRPREEWGTRGREIAMTTQPLDAAAAIAAAGEAPWDGAPEGTSIGHVHLHVGDIETAGGFYHDGLGLDKVVWSYAGALFLSAGGYHHHLGVNTWAGAAPPTGEDDAGLVEWRLTVPDAAAVDGVAESLEAAGHAVERGAGEVVVRDPWGTVVRVAS